jgi:hypothetical protein
MQGKNAQLEGAQELVRIQQKDFDNGTLLQRIIDAVNSVALNLGGAAVGKLTPPPPINSIQVSGTQSGNVITCASEHLHLTLTHNGELRKGIQYIHEIATEPNFLAPHIIDGGSSRSLFVHLPALDNNGKVQTYYHRAFAQYNGSDPQKPTVLGGLASATQIQMTGTSKCTLLSSTGSGTADPSGMQGGKGLGTVLTRPAPGPKRNVA